MDFEKAFLSNHSLCRSLFSSRLWSIESEVLRVFTIIFSGKYCLDNFANMFLLLFMLRRRVVFIFPANQTRLHVPTRVRNRSWLGEIIVYIEYNHATL